MNDPPIQTAIMKSGDHKKDWTWVGVEAPAVAVVHQDINLAIGVGHALCRAPLPAKVRIFIDPRDAWVKLRDDPPHVVVAAKDMPFLDGVRLCRRILGCHAGVACILLGASPPDDGPDLPPNVVAVATPTEASELARIIRETLQAALPVRSQ